MSNIKNAKQIDFFISFLTKNIQEILKRVIFVIYVLNTFLGFLSKTMLEFFTVYIFSEKEVFFPTIFSS